jgi:hypothetical protein
MYKILHGNEEIEFYRCNEEKDKKGDCTQVTKVFQVPSTSWFDNVHNILTSIDDKIRNNSGDLDKDEIDLIERSTLPILDLINTMACLHRSSGIEPILSKITEYVSKDLLCSYLTEAHLHVRRGLNALKEKNSGNESLNLYVENMSHLDVRIRQLKIDTHKSQQDFIANQLTSLQIKREISERNQNHGI